MDSFSLYWGPFLAIISINMIALISPGPDFAVTVKNSLLHSRKAGLWSAIGISCGEVIHLLYTVLGFGLLISQTLWLFTFVKLLGASYLIYSGYQSLIVRKLATVIDNSEKEIKENFTSFDSFRSGFFTNLLNPKAILFFLSIFTVIIDPQTPLPIMLIYGAAMTVQTFLWFGCVALVFSSIRVRHLFSRFTHWIERLTGGILIVLGAKLAFFTQR